MQIVKINNILFALIEQIANIKNMDNYVGYLPEKVNYPCFLYTLGLNKHKLDSYYTQKVTLNVDIVYFNNKNAYNEEDYMEKLEVINILEDKLLSKYYITVNGNNLDFNYDLNESDGRMLINLRFDFYDLNNTEIQEIYEGMEEFYTKIKINNKK